MSQHLKAIVAALIAVVYAGLLAWQAASGNGFQAVDLFPLTAAVGAAVLTYLVPEVPELRNAKAIVMGVLQAVAAVGVLYQNDGLAPNVTAVALAVLGTVLVQKVKGPDAAVRS